MGSDVVMLVGFPRFQFYSKLHRLPACLRHAGNFAGERELAEADAAQCKLSDIAARTSALLAAVPVTAGEFRLLLVFCNFGSCGHWLILTVYPSAETACPAI